MSPVLLLLVAALPAQFPPDVSTYRQLVGDDVTRQVRDPLGVIEIPTLRGEGATLAERIIANEITKEYRFETKTNDALVIISTKIRADFPKDNTLLTRMRGKYERMSTQMGKDEAGRDILSFQFVGPADNLYFESMLRNAVYSEAFPYALATRKRDATTGLGVSQFFVVSGRYIECALFTPAKKDETDEQLVARARQLCTELRTKIKVVK